jgi:apolipoprotein N-acyltransferase
VKSNHVPLLFGSYDRNDGRDYNTLYIQSPRDLSLTSIDPSHSEGEDLQFYHKNILLMFGEYIPFQDYIPALGKLFPQVGNFGRGSGAHLVQIPIFSHTKKTTTLTSASGDSRVSGVSAADSTEPKRLLPVSPVICYEVLFSDYVLHAANQGSRMILNITNDSWFGPYGEPHLHLALSTFRSIETRLPMVRATNTGFSALITQDGEIAAKSHLFRPEILNISVPIIDPPSTLIKRWGDWFGMFAAISGVFILGFFWLKELKSRSAS